MTQITETTRTNGRKVYTFILDNKIIAQCNCINKLKDYIKTNKY